MRHLFSLILVAAALVGCQKSDVQPADTEQQIFTCPMHPEVRFADEGKCPICKMELVLTNPDDLTSSENESANSSIRVVNQFCPMMGGEVAVDGGTAEWNDKLIGFCCPGCEEKWEKLSEEDKAQKLAEADLKAVQNLPSNDKDPS